MGLEEHFRAHAEAVELQLGHVAAVRLQDGTTIETDLFLLSTGKANIELARNAGLEVRRGIVVDERMRTSDPRILAAGDVAEAAGGMVGLWPAAVEQAQIAAANAVGADEIYAGTVPVAILKVTGVELTSVGRFEPQGPGDEVIVLEEATAARYRKLIVHDGIPVGAILLGYPREAADVVGAVKARWDMTPWLEQLRAGDWSALANQPRAAAA